MAVTKPLRIAIATGGRFHVLDLARELDALGHEVQFYSYVPKARALQFGLPARCHVSLLPIMWPFVRMGYASAEDGSERYVKNSSPSRSTAPSWPVSIRATFSLGCPG